MKNAISVCRILFFVAIIGMMTESAYSQKLKKEEQTPLPIPQDQKDLIQKIQAAMLNKQLAKYTENPVARKEAVEKADNDLKKEIGKLFEIIKNDGLNDWIALCFVNENELQLQIEILADNPEAPSGKKKIPSVEGKGGSMTTLSTKFNIRVSLIKPKDKIDPDVLDAVKKLKRVGFVKFTLAKYPIVVTSGSTMFFPPPSALKTIIQLK